MFSNRNAKLAGLAAALSLPLALTACSGAMTPAAPASSSAPSMSASTMAEPFGAACAAVPKDGKGSFDGMSQDPVATAASNNPLLSTLVTAVK
ncbi:MAG TPA: fasciclin domain-containing protein, partial [Propionicimonas sp.]|nr:fasciclin domain-containing protein [Propionicimonas sp.]